MTQQETTTDRLVSIIQLIQLGKRTGVLTVRRGQGEALEEGMITFANGQVIQTQVGRYNGSEAMNRLSAWGTCRFIFDPLDTPGEDVRPSPKSSQRVTSSLGEPRVTGNLPGARDQIPQGPRSSTEPITPLPAGDLNHFTRSPSPVPYRRLEINTALNLLERKKLGRSHRRLLLLIDGQRSIQELVRLMGRNEEEIRVLLGDLEQAVIIGFYPVPPSR